MPLPRVAVVGGDERGGRTEWPAGYDVRHFPTIGRGGERKFDAALASGKYALAVFMTKWMGHGFTSKTFPIETRYFSGSFAELAKSLGEFLPPGDATEAAGGEIDSKWYEAEEEVVNLSSEETKPKVVQSKVSIQDAMRLLERELELMADGLLEDSDVLVMVERLLQRGIKRMEDK